MTVGAHHFALRDFQKQRIECNGGRHRADATSLALSYVIKVHALWRKLAAAIRARDILQGIDVFGDLVASLSARDSDLRSMMVSVSDVPLSRYGLLTLGIFVCHRHSL